MIPDRHRIQCDVKNLPDGIEPKLKMMALEAGCSFTDFIRATLIEKAVKGHVILESESTYVPVR